MVLRSLVWWQSEPDISDVEQALIAVAGPDTKRKLESKSTQDEDLDECLTALSSPDWQTRWRARHTCMKHGGIAVRQLEGQDDPEGHRKYSNTDQKNLPRYDQVSSSRPIPLPGLLL